MLNLLATVRIRVSDSFAQRKSQIGGYHIRYGFPLKMPSKQRLREVTPSEKRLATESMKFKEYKILKFSLLHLLEIHIRPIRLKKEILGRGF